MSAQDSKSDIEVLLNTLLKSQGKNASPQIEKIKAIMDTPEGHQLMQKISGPSADALKKAATAAVDGSSADPARALLMGLMSNRDGMNLLKQVAELIDRAGK